MKKVVLSIDDARWDMYDNIFPILKKYKLTATLNVISDFVKNPDKYKDLICRQGAMTEKQIIECQEYGIEVACHGCKHQNNVEDIRNGVFEMKQMNIDVSNIGFASPTSYLTWSNSTEIRELINSNELKYIRTGLQVRREGIIYSILTWIERVTHSKRLFWLLNKRMLKHRIESCFFYSVPVTCYTTFKQLQYFIKKMDDNDVLILCLHSVLRRQDEEYGKTVWYCDYENFEELCRWLSMENTIEVITNKSILSEV